MRLLPRSLALVILLLALLWAQPAQAHASLVSSEPADGATLNASPRSLVLRFNEAVTPLKLSLLGAGAPHVDLVAAPGDATAVHMRLPRDLPRGTYALSYRVVSADSHPVGGSITFSIGEAVGERAGGVSTPVPELSAWAIVLRAARDAAVLLAAGAALFVVCVGSFPRDRRLLAVAGAAASLLTLACLGLHGTLLRDAPGDYGRATWAAALATTFGTSSVVAALGSALIAAAGLPGGPPSQRAWLMVPAALACVGSLALTGHAAAAQPRWASVAALASHALAASFWFGSLWALLAMLLGHDPRTQQALQRFSRLATWGVALLLAAGACVAAMQLRAWSALSGSQYGRLVLLKAALAAALLGLAAANRFVLLPRLARDAVNATARLRVSVSLEIVLVLAVLAATAVLVQTPPHAAAVQRTLQGSGGVAELRIEPARAGPNRIELSIVDATGRPIDAAEVEVALSNRAAGIEPITRKMERSGPGRFSLGSSELAFQGQWTLAIRARVGDFDIVRWSTEVPIQ